MGRSIKKQNDTITPLDDDSSQDGAKIQDFIYDIGHESLTRIMTKTGTRGITFEETTAETETFLDVSTVIDPSLTMLVSEDNFNVNAMPMLSSFLTGDLIPESISSSISTNDFKSKVSWTQAACVCKDASCMESAAVDPIGFFNINNGLLRGRALVVFVADDGDLLPCLKHYSLPPIEELDVTGSCKWTTKSFEMCADIADTSEETYYKIPQLYGHRCVECDDSDDIDGLRIMHHGKLVARAFNSSEMLTSYLPDPEMTLKDNLDSIPIPEGLNFAQEATARWVVKPFFVDGISSIFNLFFAAMNPVDFGLERRETYASRASFAEITRVMDFAYHSQLGLFASLSSQEGIVEKMETLPMFVSKQLERPEAAPIQEILSSISLLLLASCGFGAILGSSLKKIIKSCNKKQSSAMVKNRNNDEVYKNQIGHTKKVDKGGRKCLQLFPGIAAVLGAFVVLALEALAYWLSWTAEKEHTQFSKAIVHMEVKGSKRFTINPFGISDMRGALFGVNTYVVELSDAGENWEWLYLTGMISCAVGLVLSAVFGPVFQEMVEEDNIDEEKDVNIMKDESKKGEILEEGNKDEMEDVNIMMDGSKKGVGGDHYGEKEEVGRDRVSEKSIKEEHDGFEDNYDKVQNRDNNEKLISYATTSVDA